MNLLTLKTAHLMTCAFTALVIFTPVSVSRAQNTPPPTLPTASAGLNADEIVANMVLRNESRAAALRSYTGRRMYHLYYRGFPGNKDAELTVEARYSAPGRKTFTVLSQSGSKWIVDRVLKRLLTSEEEAQSAENRQKTALTPHNYYFELAGDELTEQGRFYILKVQPKIRNKFLYRGKIWVDANDFAVQRIEAEPAENPSFWISHTKIEQRYSKFGSLWLPVRNQSTSKVRLGGTATLVIEYHDYKLPDGRKSDTQTASTETGASN